MQKNIWADRSQLSIKKKYRGVLFSNFPEELNDYLHHWTAQLIAEHITKNDRYILDLGCGYGRLFLLIREKFSDVFLVGLDVSTFYAKEYIQHVNHSFSIVSDSVQLPFKKKSSHFIFEVFSLMYLSNKEKYRQAIGEMFSSLKDQGSILIIENNKVGTLFLNGLGIISLLSKIIDRKNHEKTKGSIFQYHEIDNMVQDCEGVVIKKIGMPVFTILIPFNVLHSFISSTLLKKILSIIKPLDKKLQFLNFLSLYQFYCIKRMK